MNGIPGQVITQRDRTHIIYGRGVNLGSNKTFSQVLLGPVVSAGCRNGIHSAWSDSHNLHMDGVSSVCPISLSVKRFMVLCVPAGYGNGIQELKTLRDLTHIILHMDRVSSGCPISLSVKRFRGLVCTGRMRERNPGIGKHCVIGLT